MQQKVKAAKRLRNKEKESSNNGLSQQEFEEGVPGRLIGMIIAAKFVVCAFYFLIPEKIKHRVYRLLSYRFDSLLKFKMHSIVTAHLIEKDVKSLLLNSAILMLCFELVIKEINSV
mmetsp:Transcript_13884/g.23653  ORF Transcript_13884/g.23653 Transcript_13884/m.23653 type:complete len:116 (-) Transcript_13884:418-765(-)